MPIPNTPPSCCRLGFFLIALGSVAALGFALYAQYGLGLEPCPLCIFQRVAVSVIAVIALLSSLMNLGKIGFRLASLSIIIVALIGSMLAGRQLWLQNLPADQIPLCGPGLDYLIEVLPFTSVLATVLEGSGECAVIAWSFWGMSMPFWVVVFLALVSVFTLWQWKHHG